MGAVPIGENLPDRRLGEDVVTLQKPTPLCEVCGHPDASVCGDPARAPPYCDIRLSIAEAWRVKRQQLQRRNKET
jgi:hypothetical protein